MDLNFADLLDDAEDGGWFIASWDGRCACDEPFDSGDEIRWAGDDGGWEARRCCGT